MPTILGPRYSPDFAGHPRHMSQEDFPIWQRWYPRVKSTAMALYFDVGLGLPDELPQSDDAAQLLGWIHNTQKRADALIERVQDVLLVELRFNANLNAIGRLQGYAVLLADDNPFKKPVVSILVSNRKDSEVARLAELNHIVYDVV